MAKAVKKATPKKPTAVKKKVAPKKKAVIKKKMPVKNKPIAKKKGTVKKNKNGVKNSLVNNINARKKKGTSNTKNKSTVSKKAYAEMEDNWENKGNS